MKKKLMAVPVLILMTVVVVLLLGIWFLKNAEDENINDIIIKAQNQELEISDYLVDSKIRNEAYTSLSIDSLNLQDKNEMENFYENITKLKENLIEYSNYREFIPLMMDFKTSYEIQIGLFNSSSCIIRA